MNSIDKYKVLGVILARGGSKGIPKKNIVNLYGKPLIFYTIIEALKSKLFTNLVVSTDDKEIANISIKYGAEVPFTRPENLSKDTTGSMETLRHAVENCEKIFNIQYDYIIELPCISPLRKSHHITEAFNKLVNTDADSVISVCQMQDKHPIRMKKIVNDKIEDFSKELREKEVIRRQDLESCYIRNGAIYSMTRDCIINQFSRKGKVSRPYLMDEFHSVNIDSYIDLKLAEILIKENS